MFKKIFFSLAILLSLPYVLNAKIIETTEIKDILEEIDEDTLVLFDMDDTLTDSSISLGTGAWRQYVRAHLDENYDTKAPENPHDMLSRTTAENIPVQAVELDLVPLIRNLQNRKIAVFCLTSRGYQLWYSTPMEGIDTLSEQQLNSIGIDFSQSTVPAPLQQVNSSLFYHGIFLASSSKKGPFLETLFEQTGYRPSKVVFIDDKLDQNKSIETTLNKLGIPNACFWYQRAQINNQDFNPLLSSIQLEAFLKDQTILTDAEAKEKADALEEEVDPDDFFKRLIATYFPVEKGN